MLTINFVNDKTGTNQVANYKVEVYVNDRRIATDYVKGHHRKHTWPALVAKLVAQNWKVAPREAPVCARCGRPRSVGSAKYCRRCYKDHPELKEA